MFEPISVSALFLGYAVLAGYARPSSAISDEANQILEAASRVMRERQGSESLFGPKAQALSRLRSAAADVFVDEDQEAVTVRAQRNAEQLVLAIPDDLPAPSFGIDPDGAISLTWMMSRTRIFSVSVTGSERLAYAWLNGSDKGHGVAQFRSPQLPAVVAMLLRSVVDDDVSLLRVA